MKNLNWLRSASVGPHFIICMLIGGFFGFKADEYFATKPVLLVLGLVFGLAAGFINLFRELKIINREEEEAFKKDGIPPSTTDSDHDATP